jgi:hypothetical protein
MSTYSKWMAASLLAILTGLAGGIFGAFLSVTYPAQSSSTNRVNPEPLTIAPNKSILLLNKGEAHASVRVDRSGLIVFDLTTSNGRNRVALGMLGDSRLEVGVFDSMGKARAGMEVPMNNAAKVQMLLLDKNKLNLGSHTFIAS